MTTRTTISQSEIKRGIADEWEEHKDVLKNKQNALKVAMEHLNKYPDYYSTISKALEGKEVKN